MHRPLQAGICGSKHSGAESVVVSGGYEDDEDHGDMIIYTGHGGRDPNSGRQIADQAFKKGNRALASNVSSGQRVRVIRGPDRKSEHAPITGFRYDGLFRVARYWSEIGRSGYSVYRFELVSDRHGASIVAEGPTDDSAPERVPQTTLRVVRDTALARRVKELHKFACQVCGAAINGPAGPYAEAAHVQPLGGAHHGPDVLENIICLCPNHHVMFDLWVFSIEDDLRLIGLPGRLRGVAGHRPAQRFLQYHREQYLRIVKPGGGDA